MNRPRWLISIVLILLVAFVGWRIWRGWGLITIHCEDWPVSRVAHAIESQGHVTLRSNAPPETPVRLHVNRVTVAEALETVATVIEGRWRLAYVFAGDAPSVQTAVESFASSTKPEGWKTLFFPLRETVGRKDIDAPVPDPRRDPWNVKPATAATAQAYLEQAAQSVSAAFTYPEAWNPSVAAAPPTGPITQTAPRLAKAAGGRMREIFLLEKDAPRTAGAPRERPAGDDEARAAFNRAGMEARMQAEIDKLPAEQRAAARKEYEDRRSFFAGMAGLTPEQRRAKIAEYLGREDTQNQIEKRLDDRSARMTPQQRVERAQQYMQNKMTTKNGPGR